MRGTAAIRQVVKPRAYLIGGTLKYRDLVGYIIFRRKHSAPAEYQHALAKYLGVSTALTYSSGRAALMEILRVLDVGPGDEVIVPGYTCIVIPAAIIAVGAKPIYADIDLRTFNVLPESVEARVTSRTRAILAQHTFGIPCDLGPLIQIAESKSMFLIEDCAHALGAKIGSGHCGGHGIAAFFSTEQSKMISTIKGGIATTNYPDVAARLRSAHANLKSDPQSCADHSVNRWFIQTMTHDPRYGRAAREIFDIARRHGPIRKAINASFDFDTVDYEAAIDGIVRQPARLANELARVGYFQIRRLEADVIARNRLVRSLEPLAMQLGWATPRIDWENTRPSFVRFPFLVDDRSYWRRRLDEGGIESGTWLNHPLHPVGSNFRKCGYEIGMCPNAEYAAERVLNIPIHPRCADWILDRVEGLLPGQGSRLRSFRTSGDVAASR
jgi:perosamine synthetase